MTERITRVLSRGRATEQERHELAVIDAAVRGAGTDRPEDAALTDFALRLSAARHLPNDGFYRELDERFGVSDAADGAPPKPRRRRAPLLAGGAGALASVVAAIVIVAGLQSNGGPASDTVESSVGVIAAPEQKQAAGGSGAADSAKNTAAAPAIGELDQLAPVRKVVQTAQLSLATPGKNVESVADAVVRVTDRFGGYVGNSSVTGGDATNASADFELRIPADKFQPALAALSKLAHVRSRTQSTEDVTAPYSRARSRLTIARAQRDRLAAQYAAATPGSREAAALRVRMARAEASADARGAELKRLQNRVNFVAMSVAIVTDETAAADDRGTIHRAADTAITVLTTIAAVLLVALAVALPLLLIAAVGWVATRRLRRTRRDGVLDRPAS